MATTDKNTIYSWFQTDDFPTEDQFRATWDSFWHKSESIPMSSITELNQLFQQTATVAQLNDKANVDGSNIDVSAYQEKLNITNLIATAKEEVKTELLNGAPEAFDTLKEISDWISDDETAEAAILQAIQNEATARTEADNQKLNKPTTTSNTASYPFVVGEDGNGNSARLPAGDLGKNFFNSDLSNTTARTHTMNAGVAVNTLGNPHTLSGLPNKNADITNFRKVRVQNASGLDSVVDSKNLLTDGMTSMTDAEKDAWRLAQRKTGENYSIGQPRIDFVFPSYINNSITYVQPLVLYGINLYIDNQTPNSIVQLNRVEDINGNTVNELYNVTNFEVSPLKTNQIVLMLNWSLYPKGKYKFKVLNNSLQSLVSDGFVILNDSVPNELNSITWQVLSNPAQAANNSALNVSNKVFSYERKGIASGIAQPTHIMYSDQELTGNFVVELNVGLGETIVYYSTIIESVYNLGLVASSSSSSSFALSVLNGVEFKWDSNAGGIYITDKGYFTNSFNADLGSGGKLYLLKFQGYITVCYITNSNNLIYLSSAIAVNEPMRLFNSFYNQGRFLNKTVNFSYGQIFTY